MTVSKKTTGSLRIIAGQWRRRRIRFDSAQDIRPTTDAAREFLFNWLNQEVVGSSCLDLFAGSGALSFEALSRGAAEAVLIDINHYCVRDLNKIANELGAGHCTILRSDALKYLRRVDRQFDIVFIDPPFHTELAIQTLRVLEKKDCLRDKARIYLEVERDFNIDNLKTCWKILRCTKARSRAHYLLTPFHSTSNQVHLNTALD